MPRSRSKTPSRDRDRDRDRHRDRDRGDDRHRSKASRDHDGRDRHHSTSSSRHRSRRSSSREHDRDDGRECRARKRRHRSRSRSPSPQSTIARGWAKAADNTDFQAELEAVKQRRAARAVELASIAQIREESERARLAAADAGSDIRESDFHRQQLQSAALIRTHQHREKPIDLLINNALYRQHCDKVTNETNEFVGEVCLINPNDLFKQLNADELQQLVSEIEQQLHLISHHDRLFDYWHNLSLVVQNELQAARSERNQVQSSVSESVLSDIRSMITTINTADLHSLKSQITENIDASNQLDYWQCVRYELHLFEAKQWLAAAHSKLLRDRLKELQEEVRSQDGTSQSLIDDDDNEMEEESQPPFEPRPSSTSKNTNQNDGSLSPRLFNLNELLEDGVPIIDAVDDWRSLDERRTEVMNQYDTLQHSSFEYSITQSLALPPSQLPPLSSSLMSDPRYRPRKPRFYNRVKTGFDWNRYNQAHYDRENPPPKLVQGYKFTVFYPDLLELGVAPRYSLTIDDGDSNFATLRFSAGAPYEDLAFRIVNKEWELAPKRGFKSVFDKGILQLHFNFKRVFYRR